MSRGRNRVRRAISVAGVSAGGDALQAPATKATVIAAAVLLVQRCNSSGLERKLASEQLRLLSLDNLLPPPLVTSSAPGKEVQK